MGLEEWHYKLRALNYHYLTQKLYASGLSKASMSASGQKLQSQLPT